MKVSESKIQGAWIKVLKEQGYIVTRLRATSEAGWPDIIFLKDGVCRFIEFKTPTGSLAPLQRLKINQLRKAGFKVYIISWLPSKEKDLIKLIEAYE